mgnify:CR=1 FL=1
MTSIFFIGIIVAFITFLDSFAYINAYRNATEKKESVLSFVFFDTAYIYTLAAILPKKIDLPTLVGPKNR